MLTTMENTRDHLGNAEEAMLSAGAPFSDKSFIFLPVYNSFLSRATGISNCSLYLATVLLAILYPFSWSFLVNLLSLSGFFLFSSSIMSCNIFFTSRVDTSSPLLVDKDSEKKYFSL